MPITKLTIVPVTLNPIMDELSLTTSQKQHSSDPSCIIKTAGAEISFFHGADEQIIRTIMKELNNR